MVIPSTTKCARFYAIPKIRKPNLAFGPIVSDVGTASYKLFHFLSQSLDHLTCNKLYSVKNSYDYVDKYKFISPSNFTMLFLDVNTLFTNVLIQGKLYCLEKGYVNPITRQLNLKKFSI